MIFCPKNFTNNGEQPFSGLAMMYCHRGTNVNLINGFSTTAGLISFNGSTAGAGVDSTIGASAGSATGTGVDSTVETGANSVTGT